MVEMAVEVTVAAAMAEAAKAEEEVEPMAGTVQWAAARSVPRQR